MSSANETEKHPDEMTIASYLEGKLPDGARNELEAHLAECDECRSGLILMRGLEGLEAGTVPHQFRQGARRRHWGSWAAAAAAVLLGALFVLPLQNGVAPGAEGQPVFRDAATRGPGLISPRAGDTVRRADLFFRWTPVEGADGYRVRVWSVETDFLVEFGTREDQTEAGWPADEPPAPSGELIWRVQAFSLNRKLAESRPASFEIEE